jgi:hypothetical protein
MNHSKHILVATIHMQSASLAIIHKSSKHICFLSNIYVRCNINNVLYEKWIWANQPMHLLLVGCLNPCLQGTSVRVGSPSLKSACVD